MKRSRVCGRCDMCSRSLWKITSIWTYLLIPYTCCLNFKTSHEEYSNIMWLNPYNALTNHFKPAFSPWFYTIQNSVVYVHSAVSLLPSVCKLLIIKQTSFLKMRLVSSAFVWSSSYSTCWPSLLWMFSLLFFSFEHVVRPSIV